MNKFRDIRLIKFTSTLRSLDVFSNARIDQSYKFFLDYEEYRKAFEGNSENLIIRQYIKETFNK